MEKTERIEDRHHASTEAIKKAYKKQSLLMHPDKLSQRGVEVTADHSQKFQKMKEAYDVLSDPRKRRLYDEIGESGIKLLESPSEINPAELIKNFQKNRADRAKIALLVSLIFAIILLEPILFCLKCDATIKSEWLAIWAPMWGVDFILLASAWLFLTDKYQPPTEEGEEPAEQSPMHLKIWNFIQTCLFILMQIFILMRLDERVDWSLFAVFAPWFAWEFMNCTSSILKAIKHIPKPNEESQQKSMLNLEEEETGIQMIVQESEYYEKTMEQFLARKELIVCLLRCWQAVFLALKLSTNGDWDWGLVLLPIWVYFALQLGSSYYLRRWGQSLIHGIDVEAIMSNGGEVDPVTMLHVQHGQELHAAGFAGVIFQIVPLYMAILLVIRLQTTTFSVFIILIPIYLAIFCCMCGVGCGLCCLSNIDTNKLDEQMKAAREGGGGGGRPADGSVSPSEKEGNTNGNGTAANAPPSSSTSSNAYGTFHDEENNNNGTGAAIIPQPPATIVVTPPPPSSTSHVTDDNVVSNSLLSSLEEGKTVTTSSPKPLLDPTGIDVDID
eukprot:gene5019-10043_t